MLFVHCLRKNIQVYRVYEERKTLEEQFLELTGGKRYCLI